LRIRLKSEIARLVRKELKSEVIALRKATTTQRSEIAALKKQINELQSGIKELGRRSPHKVAEVEAPADVVGRRGRKPKVPFGPARLLEHRKKLGLTQAQMAKLLEASTLSVHKWEAGSSVPRAEQLTKILAVLKVGKRDAIKLLASSTQSE
jgi:DNA-binding XRE family transcriptional regulator